MRLYRYSPYRARPDLGFDLFDSLFAPLGAAADAPAYNVERKDDNTYRVVVAVPGYSRDNIDITQKENVLIVTGKAPAEAEGTDYVYRGLTDGTFERRFELGDYVKVTGADLANGLLTIELVREVPEEHKPRRITIGAGAAIENRPAA